MICWSLLCPKSEGSLQSTQSTPDAIGTLLTGQLLDGDWNSNRWREGVFYVKSNQNSLCCEEGCVVFYFLSLWAVAFCKADLVGYSLCLVVLVALYYIRWYNWGKHGTSHPSGSTWKKRPTRNTGNSLHCFSLCGEALTRGKGVLLEVSQGICYLLGDLKL